MIGSPDNILKTSFTGSQKSFKTDSPDNLFKTSFIGSQKTFLIGSPDNVSKTTVTDPVRIIYQMNTITLVLILEYKHYVQGL